MVASVQRAISRSRPFLLIVIILVTAAAAWLIRDGGSLTDRLRRGTSSLYLSPTQQQQQQQPPHYSSIDSVYFPLTVRWPSQSIHGSMTVVYDMWFRSPTELFMICWNYSGVEEKFDFQHLRVVVDGVNITGRFTRESPYDQHCYIVFYLSQPAAVANTVDIGFTTSPEEFTFRDVQIQSLSGIGIEPHRAAAATTAATTTAAHHHGLTLSTFLSHDHYMLPLMYEHYTQQGVSHFIIGYNAVDMHAVWPLLLKRHNIEYVHWPYTYWFLPTPTTPVAPWLAQAQQTWLTMMSNKWLPHHEWMLQVDVDEFVMLTAAATTAAAEGGVSEEATVTTAVVAANASSDTIPPLTILSFLQSRPIRRYYTIPNKFAHAVTDWRQWLKNYTIVHAALQYDHSSNSYSHSNNSDEQQRLLSLSPVAVWEPASATSTASVIDRDAVLLSPFVIAASVEPALPCPTRTKTIYHRSFRLSDAIVDVSEA